MMKDKVKTAMFYIILFIILIALVFKIASSQHPNYANTKYIPSKTSKKISSKAKGEIGERKVVQILDQMCDENSHCINNLMITSPSGCSTQIDHIYINQAGVFVIETKNYSGLIYGGEEQRSDWTQYLGGKKYKIYNPLKQNNAHKQKIRDIIGHYTPVFSLIVFVQNNAQMIYSKNVIGINELRDTIKEHQDFVLSKGQIDDIYYKLLNIKTNPETSEKQHIENVKHIQESVNHNICPLCGGTLVERINEYGTFYGCSNYPRCHFIKK